MSGLATVVVYEGPETFSLRQVPLPDVDHDGLLAAVEICGVDGSELHMFRGELPWFNERAPIIFGDEIIARVVEIGDGAKAARGLGVGDRIVIEARWPCSGCPQCDLGQYYLCANNPTGRGYGTISMSEAPGLWGGYATHVCVPGDALTYRLPDGMDLRTALVSCSLLANSMRWAAMARTVEGATCAIIGPGPQGLGCAAVAARNGMRVVMIGLARDRARMEFARSLGPVETIELFPGETPAQAGARIRSAVGPIQSVIEAAGAEPARQLAMELVQPCGTVAQVSIPHPIHQSVDWLQALMKEVTILNPVSHPHTVPQALALGAQMAAEGLDVGRFVTHVLPLAQAETAIRLASLEAAEVPIKVALDPTL